MILSVSRRTDIPNHYSEWFLNRIKEGYLYVRNPMNHHQVSKINLSPDVVDCIVFWTKNPEPMIDKLEQLKDYKYYFQFTLTGYGNDIESLVPHKRERMIPVFQRLSQAIGKEKVVWRYDPILCDKITGEDKITERVVKSLKQHVIPRVDNKRPHSVIDSVVTVTVDRPLGSYHPKHKDIYYPVNYGYIEGVIAADGEEQDAYILGIDRSVDNFSGKVIAVIHRNDDAEEKWVVCPENMMFTESEIMKQVYFQEKYFDSYIEMR